MRHLEPDFSGTCRRCGATTPSGADPIDPTEEIPPMILPRIRASFDRSDAMALVEILGRSDPEARARARERLDAYGIDVLLDDPRILPAILSASDVGLRPPLIFYVLVRHALLERGVDDPATADYLASMVMAFAFGRRAWSPTGDPGDEFEYMVDLLIRLSQASDPGDRFLVQTHTGNYALWLTGVFPDFVEGRRRRGAPPYQYYEALGSAGFRSAAESDQAVRLGMDGVLREVSLRFGQLRGALNRLSDRYLWRDAGNPVGRLIREVQWKKG